VYSDQNPLFLASEDFDEGIFRTDQQVFLYAGAGAILQGLLAAIARFGGGREDFCHQGGIADDVLRSSIAWITTHGHIGTEAVLLRQLYRDVRSIDNAAATTQEGLQQAIEVGADDRVVRTATCHHVDAAIEIFVGVFSVSLHKSEVLSETHPFKVCAVFYCHRSLRSSLTWCYIRLLFDWLHYTILLSFSIGEEA
jgi:hypothetical protein